MKFQLHYTGPQGEKEKTRRPSITVKLLINFHHPYENWEIKQTNQKNLLSKLSHFLTQVTVPYMAF